MLITTGIKMGEKYYISIKPRTDGTYSIHKEGCPFIPECGKHIFLGTFQSVKSAIEEGQKYFESAGTCRFCLKEHCQEKGYRIFTGKFRISGSGLSVIPYNSEHASALVCCKN